MATTNPRYAVTDYVESGDYAVRVAMAMAARDTAQDLLIEHFGSEEMLGVAALSALGTESVLAAHAVAPMIRVLRRSADGLSRSANDATTWSYVAAVNYTANPNVPAQATVARHVAWAVARLVMDRNVVSFLAEISCLAESFAGNDAARLARKDEAKLAIYGRVGISSKTVTALEDRRR